jgi:predicted  nucleic acid-binding Zn-ribbon protein
MPEKTHATLRDLQEIDQRIAEAEDRIGEFDPQLAEVDEPAMQLEQEATTTRSRLKEMKLDERRLELAAEEKRQRIKKLQERLTQVRNVREEAAVSTEIDMLRSALDGEEQEAYTLIDHIRRLEVRLSEQERALEEAREAIEPRQRELLDLKAGAERELQELRAERESRASQVAPKALRLYEGIRGSRRRQAVSELTADGACSNCFSMIPLQLQNEVRTAGAVVRCEACGVILTAPRQDPEG